MTLLGKILTVLILIMSVWFLGFAMMVYATHTNWRQEAESTKQTLQNQQEVNRQLKEMQADLTSQIALEQAARRHALASLETKLATRTKELERVQQELAKATATEGTTAGALVAAQNELTNVTTEVKQLRDEIRVAQDDADSKFQDIVKLTDQLNQLRRIKAGLEDRQAPLLQSVASMKEAMEKLGVHVDVSTDGAVRTDADGIPPKVDGIVVGVGEKNLLEISIGADDGIQIGNKLDVYRDNAYLGKVVILKTAPDRAVAEIIPEFRRGTIRKGDRVATKFS